MQRAAEGLRDVTAILGDYEVLGERIPVVKKSINDLIAGPDRTLADLFDYTGKNLYRLCFEKKRILTLHLSSKIGQITWKGIQPIL